MSELKQCTNCKQEKPLTEFYRRKSKGGLYHSWCKPCMKGLSKDLSKALKDNLTPAYASETMLIDALRGQGIAAYPGKAMSYAHVDVIAWGCVGIEVKKGTYRPNIGYSWTFSPQQTDALQADIIALIADEDIYLFPATHDVFFHNGERKQGISYLPSQDRKHSPSRRTALNDNEMSKALHAWHLIEVYRVAFGVKLRQGQVYPKWVR